MGINITEYLVILCVRPAEINGLKELPGKTKDNLTPIVLLASWLSTSPLSRALQKFEEAYPTRPYFLDVDTYYQVSTNRNEAKHTWSQLTKKPADLDVWWEILSEFCPRRLSDMLDETNAAAAIAALDGLAPVVAVVLVICATIVAVAWLFLKRAKTGAGGEPPGRTSRVMTNHDVKDLYNHVDEKLDGLRQELSGQNRELTGKVERIHGMLTGLERSQDLQGDQIGKLLDMLFKSLSPGSD